MSNKNSNYNSNNNKNNNKKNNKNNKTNSFNKQVSLCLKDCKLFENKDTKIKYLDKLLYKTDDEYQKSFDDIIEFSKSITTPKKNAINTIIYHADNEDGLFSAYIVWKYLKDNDKTDDLEIIPMKPASAQHKIDYRLQGISDQLKDKNIIILDISYSKINLEFIVKNAKKVYIIDDHPRRNNDLKNMNDLKNSSFIGDDKHAAIAYTWKFFYPKENVPIFVQSIDNNDRKLNLPFIYHQNLIRTYNSFRITHSPYLKKFDSLKSFEKLNEIFFEVDQNFKLLVGHYYDEIANNIKEQVARNASKQYFQGHPVYVLNYNDPVLYKMVGRQMITNAEQRKDDIHFAVLWGYEYTSQAYKVFLSEKHTGGNPKYNLKNIAETLARKGGHRKGGGGSRFVGNFYWPRDKKHDIWDLFTKTATFIKDKKN